MKVKNPLISVVIPVYNAEKYLKECIDSVIGQDIGFVDNIELILVNDGSVDSSSKICMDYESKYPSNIVYVYQKNSGASHARNTGIDAARGDFICFIDSDDYISKDSFSSVMGFFKNASKNVDVAVIRVVQVGSKNRERPINRKFDQGTRVVDLNNPEWFDIYPRVAPSFIRSSIAKKYKFNEDIRFYEDTRYLNEVVSRTMKLGVVNRGVYYNRKHDEDDVNASITTGATSEKRFYLDSPEKVSLYLLKKFKGKNDYPPLYIQYLVQYEMRWRMFYNSNNPKDILNSKEYRHYQKINKDILKYISDEGIVGFKLSNVWQRVYLLNMKHNTDILKQAIFSENNKLTWNNHIIFNHMKKLQVRLTDVRERNNELILKGYFADFIVDGLDIYPKVDGVRWDSINLILDSKPTTEKYLEYPSYRRTEFTMRVPLNLHAVKRVEFAFTIKNKEYIIKHLYNSTAIDIDTRQVKYSKVGDYLISWRSDGLAIARNTIANRVGFEFGRLKRYLILLYKRSR